MTDFQKEVGLAAVLLVFFFGCFCYAGIVRTETAGRSWTIKPERTIKNENCEGASLSAGELF